MQSGISASQSLHDAFAAFTSDPSLFCLPVTIESEALVPLDAVRFSGGHLHGDNDDDGDYFASSLPSLAPHLQEKRPIYLLVRPSPTASALLTAVTYVPSTSPVRAKTLFASTRQSLTRTLGLERFGDSLFVTDAFEARAALRDLADGELVQLGLDLANERLVLLLRATLTPDQVQAKVPTDRPTYNVYRYTGSDAGVLFIYVCPGVSKVKERMMYASSRNGVIETAKAEGVAVAKRLELDADDITADRLAEEAGVVASSNNKTGSAGARGAAGGGSSGGAGFARPKRPGRR
ncbi:hypothetical protein DV737_g2722, partial [Chaetothyriales sp. CBS 132003]